MYRSTYRYDVAATCLVKDCPRRPLARSMCNTHYQRFKKTGEPGAAVDVVEYCLRCGEKRDSQRRGKYCTRSCKDRAKAKEQRERLSKTDCSVVGCERAARAASGRGAYCSMHYRRIRLSGDPGDVAPVCGGRKGVVPCTVPGCERFYYAKGLCSLHYNRRRLTGDVGPAGTTKAAPGMGTYMSQDGYIYVVHQSGMPKGRRLKKIALHRLVMERELGRPLLSNESVHHKNGDRADNRPENLELWSKSQPAGQRVTDKVAWALELLALYAPETLADRPVQLRLIG